MSPEQKRAKLAAAGLLPAPKHPRLQIRASYFPPAKQVRK